MITTRVLDADQATQALAECLDPGGRHPAGQVLPDELITSTRSAP
ncbi:hypothetical protein ACIBHX_46210 [Nonomuraea sp. NPDC050536]